MNSHERFMTFKNSKYICPSTGNPLDHSNGPDLACGVPASNMGRLAHCQNGGCAEQNTKLMYTTTGTIDKNHFQCNQQKGGCKPKSTCKFRQHSIGTRVNGYYLDLEAPKVANRPIVRTHNNINQSKFKGGPSFLDRQFGCRQPYWTEQCD